MFLLFFIFFSFTLKANDTESFSVIDYVNSSLNLVEENSENLIAIGKIKKIGNIEGVEFYPQISFKPANIQGKIEIEEIKVEWSLFDFRGNFIDPNNNYMQIVSDGDKTPIEFIKFNYSANRNNSYSKKYLESSINKELKEKNLKQPSNFIKIKTYNGFKDQYEQIIQKPKSGPFENLNKFIIDLTERHHNDFYIKEEFKNFYKNRVALLRIKELNEALKKDEKTALYKISNVNLFDNYRISFPIFLSNSALNFKLNQILKIVVTIKYNKGIHRHSHSIAFGGLNELNNLNLIVIAESSNNPYKLGIKNLENESEFDNVPISRLFNGVEVQKINRKNSKIFVSKITNEAQELDYDLFNNCQFLITKEQDGITENIENEQIVFKNSTNNPLANAKFNIKVVKKVGENTLTLASSTLRAIIIKENKVIFPVIKEYRPIYFKYLEKYYGVSKSFKIKDSSEESLILEDVSLINNSTLNYRLTLPEENLNNFKIFSNFAEKENLNEKNQIGSLEYEIGSLNYVSQGRSSSIKMLINSNKISLKNPKVIETKIVESEIKRKILVKGLNVRDDANRKIIDFDEDKNTFNFKELEVVLDTNIEIVEGEVFKFSLPLTYKIRNYYEIIYKANKNINLEHIVYEDIKPSKIMFPIIRDRISGQEDRIVGYENLISKGLFSYFSSNNLFNFSIYENENLKIKVDILAPEVEFPEISKFAFDDRLKEIEYLDDNETKLEFNYKKVNEKSVYKILGTKNKIEIGLGRKNQKGEEQNDSIYIVRDGEKNSCFTIKDSFLRYSKNRIKDENFEKICSIKDIKGSEFEIQFPKEALKFHSGYSLTKWDKEEIEIWCNSDEKDKENREQNWRAYPLSFSVNRVHLKVNNLYFTKMNNSEYSHETIIDGAIFKGQKVYLPLPGINREVELIVRTLSKDDALNLSKDGYYLTDKNILNNYIRDAEIQEGSLFLFDKEQAIKKEPLGNFLENVHDKLRIAFIVKAARVESINFQAKEVKSIYSSKVQSEKNDKIYGIRKENGQLEEVKDNYNNNEYSFFLSLEDLENINKKYSYIKKNVPLKYRLGFSWEYFSTKAKKEGVLENLYRNERNIASYNNYLVENNSDKKFIEFLEHLTSDEFVDNIKLNEKKIDKYLEGFEEKYHNNLLNVKEYIKKIENFSTSYEDTNERESLKNILLNTKNELMTGQNFKLLKPSMKQSLKTFSNRALDSKAVFKEELDFKDLDRGITLNEQQANIFTFDLAVDKKLNYNSYISSVIENNLKILIFPELEENEKFVLSEDSKMSALNPVGVTTIDKIAIRNIPIYILPKIKTNIVAPDSAFLKRRIDIKIYNDFAHDEFENQDGTRNYRKKDDQEPSFKLGLDDKEYWKVSREIKSKYNLDPIIYLKNVKISSGEKTLNLKTVLEKVMNLKINSPDNENLQDNLKIEIISVIKDFFNSINKDLDIIYDKSYIMISVNKEDSLDNRSKPFEYIKILLRNFSANIDEEGEINKITSFFPIAIEMKNILIDYNFFKKDIKVESETSIELNDNAKKTKSYQFEDLIEKKKINLKVNRIRRK